MKSLVAFLICLTFSLGASAKDVAMVTMIKGNAFIFGKGFSKPLKYGSRIQDLSEVMVEDGSVLSIDDFSEHTYHLTGGSHIKFFKNVIEVKAGKVWVNSNNQMDKYMLQTSNAVTNFTKGQFVLSYDSYTAKTQVLVMQGEINFYNVMESTLDVTVLSGQFSLVDKNYNEGLPRTPTSIGKESYRNIKFAFNGIETLEKVEFDSAFKEKSSSPNMQAASRSIASVDSNGSVPNVKKGKLYFYSKKTGTVGRVPASASASPMDYYKDHLKASKKVVKKSVKKTKIHIFGGLDSTSGQVVSSNPVNINTARQPASVEVFNAVNEINSAFDKSLEKAMDQNKRHPEEVNKLIQDLKSYDQTFKKNY